MKLQNPKNKLGNYLALTLGAGTAATTAGAATTVTLYGQGVTTPAGIDIGSTGNFVVDSNNSKSSYFATTGGASDVIFTRGGNLTASAGSKDGPYHNTTSAFLFGAQSGGENYANITFNGPDDVYEAVGQFYFDGTGGGYLIALAQNSDNSALSISDGKTAIDNAAVSAIPEPSSNLALLALGSAGLLIRRRMERAA
jgi:hypothetical protein